jgi:type I restriction enzyme M protein
LPGNVFVNAGAGVKTNLLFFTKGKATEKIWYYDMSDIKVRKKLPFTLDKFEDFFARLSSDKEEDKLSDKSWYIDVDTLKGKNYDLKAVNPNIKEKVIPKPEELIKIIEESQAKINESLAKLKKIG